MSTRQAYAIEEYWPTEPWLEVYRDALDASSTFSTQAEGWGDGWNGAFVFHIQNLPVAEHTLGDLPEELVALIERTVEDLLADHIKVLAAAPEPVLDEIDARSGTVRERVTETVLQTPIADAPDLLWPELRAEVPAVLSDLLAQVEENVVDGDTVYAYLDIHDGGCREVSILESLDEREHGFVLRGRYEEWKDLIRGEADVIDQIMGGRMDVDGDMQRILQYSGAAVTMTEVAAETESRFLF